MKLQDLLNQKGISQMQLSYMSRVSSSDLSQAINEKKPFFPAWRRRVAAALDMPEEEVFPEYSK